MPVYTNMYGTRRQMIGEDEEDVDVKPETWANPPPQPRQEPMSEGGGERKGIVQKIPSLRGRLIEPITPDKD